MLKGCKAFKNIKNNKDIEREREREREKRTEVKGR